MSGPSIFISGGAGGIGLATAKRFLAEGWRVGIGDLDPAALQRARSQAEVETFEHDVRDYQDWDRVLDAFCGRDGALDVLVNNAGVLTFGWLDEQDPATFANIVDVNIKGVLYGSHAGVKRLARADHGCLVNIGSSASLEAPPILALYAATKFAVRGLSEALDVAYLRHGVRVACVEPFCVDTPMLDADDPSGRNYRAAVQSQEILSPDDVAAAVWAAAHGEALHYPVGEAPRRHLAEFEERFEVNRVRARERFAATIKPTLPASCRCQGGCSP